MKSLERERILKERLANSIKYELIDIEESLYVLETLASLERNNSFYDEGYVAGIRDSIEEVKNNTTRFERIANSQDEELRSSYELIDAQETSYLLATLIPGEKRGTSFDDGRTDGIRNSIKELMHDTTVVERIWNTKHEEGLE